MSQFRVMLRDVTAEDLAIFFEHQLDPLANRMAAFTAENPADKAAFLAHWAKILSDDTIIKRTVLFEGQVVGHVFLFEEFGQRQVAYWIGRPFWGRGLATQALSAFLQIVTERPLYARAVNDNVGSLRVLEKCGFLLFGHNKDFANGRGEVVEEVILKLDE